MLIPRLSPASLFFLSLHATAAATAPMSLPTLPSPSRIASLPARACLEDQPPLLPPDLRARRLIGARSSSDATGSRSREMGHDAAPAGHCTTTSSLVALDLVSFLLPFSAHVHVPTWVLWRFSECHVAHAHKCPMHFCHKFDLDV